MKVKNLRSKNTNIKLPIMKEKKRVLKLTVKNHRLLSKDKSSNVF